MITHAIELSEPDAGVFPRDLALFHLLHQQVSALFIVRAGIEGDVRQMVQAIGDCLVKVIIGFPFGGAHGGGIPLFFSPFVLFLQVGPPNIFDPYFETVIPGPLMQPLQVIHPIPPVHLKGIPYNRSFFVVGPHHLLHQVICGILHPALLCIYKQWDVQVVGLLAGFLKPADDAAPFCFFGRGKFFPAAFFLIQGQPSIASRLEYRKGDGFLLFYKIQDFQRFCQGIVQRVLGILPLHGIIQNRTHPLLPHLFDYRHAIRLAHTPAEMVEYGGSDQAFHRELGLDRKIGDAGPDLYQGFYGDQFE